MREKVKIIILMIASIFMASCLILAEKHGAISSSQVYQIFILIMAILCPAQGLYYKMNVENDNVMILRKDLATYYDIRRFKAHGWKHSSFLGILFAISFVICLTLNNDSVTNLVLIAVMLPTLHYFMWFRGKKYLLDPNIRPDIDFWGRLRKESP